MSTEREKAVEAVTTWHLGQTSERYESSGRGAGVISTGDDDHGGVSYGAYQLSNRSGTLQEYLDQSPYGVHFQNLTPATQAFNETWRDLARTDPDFGRDQHAFIGRSHYEEQLSRLEARGIDLRDRGIAIQDLLWSTSVQFRGLTTTIVSKGLAEKFPDGYRLEDVTDREIIEAAQDYKIAHNNTLFRSSSGLWPGLLRRANAEKVDLLELAGHEEILNANLLSNPTNPHNALYRQSLTQIHAHETQHGITPGPHSQNLAAAITLEAIREGLHRIDRVEFNADGDLARAIQVSALRDEPWLNRMTQPISTDTAIAQSLAATSEQARELDASRRLPSPHPPSLHPSAPQAAAPAL